jgi:protein TonB
MATTTTGGNLNPLKEPTSASASGSYGGTSRDSGLFKRGPIGLFVIALHLVLIYAIAGSLGIVELPSLAKPMEAVFIDMPQTEKTEPVKVVQPDLEQPMIETPPLENTIPEIEVPTDEPAPAAITAEVSSAPPVQETANMSVSRRVDPVYPPGSRRDGEEGTGLFRVLVDERGRPLDVQVLKSSGFPRLDQAAITAIRKWAFKPAVQNSQPVQSWTRVQVAFQLENA